MDKRLLSEDLFEFMRETIAADNYRDLAARILKATASKLNADIGTLWRAITEGNRERLILAATYEVEFLPTEEEPIYDVPSPDSSNDEIDGLTAWIAVRKKPVKIDSPEQLNDPDVEWAGSHSGKWDSTQFWQQSDRRFGCLIGYPLTLHGNLLGVIKFERYLGKDPFTQGDKERLNQWLELIALTLQGMISREEQERSRQQALRELSSKLLVPTSRTYYQDIVKLTAKILRADICTMWLIDEKTRKLSLAAQFGLNPEAIATAKNYDLPKSETVPDEDIHGLTVWVFVRNRTFFAQNWDKLSEHPSHRGYWDEEQWDKKPDLDFGCLYAAPLRVENRPIGVLKVERRKTQDFQSFNEVELTTFDHIAMTVSVAPPLKAVIRDRDDLVLDYFHILRAPTSNAITALESLRRELQRGKGLREEKVKSRLNMLADNLAVAYTQTLNAFEAATLPERPSAPSWRNLLRDVICSSIEMLRRLFPEVDIQVLQKTNDFELSLTDFQVKRLNVVIHNLVDNAIAFCNKKPVRIEAFPDSENDWLILSVIDNGIGIPANDIAQIWKPGFTSRSDAMTRPESRGQGLTSVSNILEEFGWHRTLDTVPGKGTAIHIHIKKDYWRKVA